MNLITQANLCLNMQLYGEFYGSAYALPPFYVEQSASVSDSVFFHLELYGKFSTYLDENVNTVSTSND